jgi:tetratricopeptide (TPR) repeat protein
MRSIVGYAGLFVLFLAWLSIPAGAQQTNEANRAAAKAALDEGVQAYKDGHLPAATADFERAKQLDPSFKTARLYLATSYASQFIPGVPTAENLAFGQRALEEFKGVLTIDATNLTAIDGIGSILYNSGGNPFGVDKLNESKTYHERHIALRPSDPEPYYWIGVIDWSICYKANRGLRDEWSQSNPNEKLAPAAPLPEGARQDFAQKCAATVDESMARLKKAIELRPDYDDAMAYLNLVYRLKADMETSDDARDEDLRMAAELVDKVKAIKEKRAIAPNQN